MGLDEWIGFVGAVPILVVFCVFNRNILNVSGFVVISILIYGMSLFTGIMSNEMGLAGNMESAIVAGFGAPIVYSIILSLLLKTNTKKLISPLTKQSEIEQEDVLDWPPK
jgi:uncharacterized membrane protein